MTDSQARVVITATDQTGRAISSAKQGLTGLQSAAAGANAMIAKLGIGLSVTAVVSGLVRAANAAIQFGDEVQKASARTGIAAGEFAKLAKVAQLADVDIATLGKGFKSLQVALSQAGTGAKAPLTALEALGLKLEDLKRLQPEQQFELLADRISQLKDPADRVRAAVELFGKAGADLLPLFEQGSEGIRKARQEVEKLGGTLTDEQIAKLADADDAIKRLQVSWEGFAASLTAKVAPALTEALDKLSNYTSGTKAGLLRGQISFLKEYEGRSAVMLGAGPNIPSGVYGPEGIAALRKQLEGELARLERLSRPAPGGFRGSATGSAAPGYVATAKAPAKTPKAGRDWHEAIAGEINAAYREAMTTAVEVNDDLMRPLGQMIEDAGNQAEKALEANAKAIEKEFGGTLKGMSVFAEEAARNLQDTLAEFLFDPFQDGLDGMLRGFTDVLRRMAAEAAAARIFEWLGGKAGSGGILGAIGGFLGAAATKKALGGPVTGGRPYVVGETGPELFVPTSSGTIQPRLAGVNGITVHNTFHISAPDGRVSRATQQQVAAAAARGTSLASRRNN